MQRVECNKIEFLKCVNAQESRFALEGLRWEIVLPKKILDAMDTPDPKVNSVRVCMCEQAIEMQ